MQLDISVDVNGNLLHLKCFANVTTIVWFYFIYFTLQICKFGIFHDFITNSNSPVTIVVNNKSAIKFGKSKHTGEFASDNVKYEGKLKWRRFKF